MTQYHLTIDADDLQNFLTTDEGLAKLVEQVLNQVLEAQVSEQLGAEPYERTDGRRGYRNGHRDRQLHTRVGSLKLRVPQVRDGQFSTALFKRYQRSEQALVLALMEMVINGVSTRKVRRITEELCGTSFAKSTVSDLCKQLDPVVRRWNHRSLADQEYPFLIVDAIVLKIRENGRVRQHSALVVVGINDAGYREILGIQVGDSESETSWSGCFAWLKDRGLSGVDIVTSDDHGGLVNAIAKHFQGATWQRCQTHFTRNILDKCPKQHRAKFLEGLRAVLRAPSPQAARLLRDQLVEAFAATAPNAIAVLEAGFDDATAVLPLPEYYRRRLRTTNGLERLNREIRRRERVIGIFPNRASALRLMGALLMEQDEEWAAGRIYLTMDDYWEWRQEREKQRKRDIA